MDYDSYDIDKNTFFSISPRKDNKKPIGIITKDLKLNIINNHQLIQNENFHKIILMKNKKLEKIKEMDNSLFKNNNVEIVSVDDNLDLNSSVEIFMNVNFKF